MKKILFLFSVMMTLAIASCSDDDPELVFHNYSGEYAIGSDKVLDVTLNSVTVTDKGSSVVISTADNKIASITLKNIIPGYGEVSVGGIEIKEAPDNNGIVFAGQMALNEKEMAVFSGSIIDGKLSIDIKTVPIQAGS